MIKFRKKHLLIIIPIVLFIIIAIILTIGLSNKKGRNDKSLYSFESTFQIYSGFGDDTRKNILNSELDRLKGLHPDFKFKLYDLPFQDLDKAFREKSLNPAPDLIVTSSPLRYEKNMFYKSELWYGKSWILLYNRSVLTLSGIEIPPNGNLIESMTAERNGMDVLNELFEKTAAAGFTPIALGSKYGLPLAAWIQHLTAFENGVDTAENMLSSDFSDTSEAYQLALKDFKTFIENGWVDPDYTKNDWPVALKKLLNGDAAFMLINENQTSSIPGDKVDDIGFTSFPNSSAETGQKWLIGSVNYISIPSAAINPETSNFILNYLTSEGTVNRLRQQMLIPFFRKNYTTKIIPSITSGTSSDLIREIRDYFFNL